MYKFELTDPHFLPHCACQVELSIFPGQLLTIVGENGIGKTTLAHRIWQERNDSIVLIEQRPLDIFYDRSLKKIKDILLQARGDEVSWDFFESIWSRLGLLKKEDRQHSSLSGGEGQALKISLGLALKAECFILDEPSQFLDQETKKVLNNIISELLLMNKSIILIEHDYDWLKVPNTLVELGLENGVLKKVKSWST